MQENRPSAAKLVSLCFAILALACPVKLPAQIQNGEIIGIVTDTSGAVLVNAVLTIQNLETNQSMTLRTNSSGLYAGKQLRGGRYQITAAAARFASVTTAVRVTAGTVVRTDFQLQVARNVEIVETRSTDASANMVNTENARLATIIDAKQIADLPLNGRNVYDLVKYVPGATDVRGVILEEGSQAVVNGVRENFAGFLLNGLSNRALDGGVVNRPIVDSIEEMQVITLNNSAEFGNAAGAITSVVTKSGTNRFHGGTWWFVRNDAFDANSFFANHTPDAAARVKPEVRLNQFGVTVGGPIKKNRLFFFAGYQGDRFITSSPAEFSTESPELRQAVARAFPNSVANVLYSHFAPSMRGTPDLTVSKYVMGGTYSGSGFASFADYLCPTFTDGTGVIANRFATLFGVEQADINQMNLPDYAGGCPDGSPFSAPVVGMLKRTDPLLQRVLSTAPSQTGGDLFNGNEASLRLDYNFGSRNSLFFQTNWALSADRFGDGNLVRGFPDPGRTASPNLQANYIHSFAPTLINEFRVGYAGSLTSSGVTVPGVPAIYLDDGTLGFGSSGELPDSFHQSIYTLSDSVALNRGKHGMKAGADLRRNIENSDWNMGRPAYLFFDPLFLAIDAPYGEFAGVDPGIINHQPAHLASSTRHWRNWEFGLYLEDDWKVTRKLTLNLGLRYDLYTRLAELNDLAATFRPGPGQSFVDNITTGAGQIKNASQPCLGNPLATIAGACGPGGFAPVNSLGAGDHNNFGPRFGFAWDPFGNGRTSLRGGFGISYQSAIYRPYSNTRWNPPFYSLNGAFNALLGDISHVVYGPVGGGSPTFLGPAPPDQHSGVGVQATGNISGWDPSNPNIASQTSIIFPGGLPDPSVKNYFLGIQREIRRHLVLGANYVGTSGSNLIRADNVNRIPGGRLPEGTCVKDNLGRLLCSQVDSRLNTYGEQNNPIGRLNPNYGVLRVWRDIAESNYSSLQLSLNGKPAAGLQLSANYTFSHAIDSGSSWHNNATSVNGFAAGDGFLTDTTLPSFDRGNSTYDVRHRLTITYTWDLPFFRSRQGLLKVALAGWQLNGLWAAQSGAHWTPYDPRSSQRFDELAPGACQAGTFDPTKCVNVGADYNLDGVANDRPNAVADHIHATRQQWADGFNLPPNFFTAPCLACVGNLGRNTFVGPGYWAADVSIFKNFKLTEVLQLQFRAEAFNVLNHTNFQIGHNAINDPSFGQAGGTGDPRNLQVALKLMF
jgi:Carboxypeptidase regulatory-like domain/TonB dependent receptor-like, beta-barrel